MKALTLFTTFILFSCSAVKQQNDLIIALERDIIKEYCKIVPAHAQDIIMYPEEITICTISEEKSYDKQTKVWGYSATSKLYRIQGATADKLKQIILDPMSNDRIKMNYEKRKSSIIQNNEDLPNEFWVKECLFKPGFAIRFKDGENFTDCLICLGCNQWQFVYESIDFDLGDIDSVKEDLKGILRQAFPTHKSL